MHGGNKNISKYDSFYIWDALFISFEVVNISFQLLHPYLFRKLFIYVIFLPKIVVCYPKHRFSSDHWYDSGLF